jgi:hypothetical protein
VGGGNGRPEVQNIMISKWDNPYKVNAYRSATDALVLYEDHIRNTPRLWASLYEIDDCPISGDIGDVLQRLRQEQREHARTSVSKRSH